ncbi:MAG TPA: gephyrin-like molybdotransferase Glp [Acidobacteriota bacterium]|nr:gephyrin-like molybdotransferase Glp [Acidobacteriota bacterium]
MIDYEAARKAVLEAARPLGAEEVRLEEAFQRVLAADIISPRALPPFDNSAMDGYAVRSQDTAAGTVTLRLAGEAPAGTVLFELVAPGTVVKIMTGALVPPGADAVIPREDVREGPEEIVVARPVASGANIRRSGEDIREGETALKKGALLNSAAVGFLAALGIAKVPVSLRPSVAVITTGGEIRDVSEALDPGAIYDSNSHILRAQIASAGARLSFAGRAGDDLGATVAVLRDALRTSRIVLTTGGVSMGDYDLVRDAFEAIGARRVFWKVAQKPGMPLAFYVLDGAEGPRWFFGLPGNPGAVMILFEEYVRPFLGLLSGRTDFLPEELEVRLSRDVKKKKGRLHFLRVRLSMKSGEIWAEETGGQGSGLLRSMVPVDAMALVPAEAEFLPSGTKVKAHRVGW